MHILLQCRRGFELLRSRVSSNAKSKFTIFMIAKGVAKLYINFNIIKEHTNLMHFIPKRDLLPEGGCYLYKLDHTKPLSVSNQNLLNLCFIGNVYH